MHSELLNHLAVAQFTTAVLDVFGNEPWAIAERYIERIWTTQRLDGDPAWTEIRHLVRWEWPLAAVEEFAIGAGEVLP